MHKSKKKKIGLALSSGSARGLAHIGVLEVLENEGIPIDMIAGTSIGALIGALYANSKNMSQIKHWAANLGSTRFVFLAHLMPTRTGLIQGKKIENQLKSIIGDRKFRDLMIPFACVATDINTGEEIVIKEGSVVEGIRASFSLPGVFSAVKREGRYLVDGGLMNPVPVSVLKEMGADFIIASNVVPDMKDRVYQSSKSPKQELKAPNLFDVIMRTIHIAGYQAVRFSLSGADIVIEPQVVHIGFGDFHRSSECISQGKLAAQNSILEIKKKIKV